MKTTYAQDCWRRLTALVCAIAALASCEPSDSVSWEYASRDSAGVEIISSGPAVALRHLGPILDTTREQHVQGLELSKVTAARLLRGGKVAFTDDFASTLVILTPETGDRVVAGGRGDGPSEFRGFRGMWRCANDTLVVRSGIVGVKVFDATGKFVRMNSAVTIRSAAYGVSDDCASIAIPVALAESEPLVTNDTSSIVWHSLNDTSIVAVAQIASQPRQIIPFLGSELPVSVPFAARPVVAVKGDRVYIGPSSVPEVRVYGREGQLVRILRWNAPRPRLTRDDMMRYDSVRLRMDHLIGAGTGARVPALGDFDLPEVKPFYSELFADDEGRLWVRKYPDNWEGYSRAYGPALSEAKPEWWIFDETGHLLGTVAAPRNYEIMDVRDGIALGVRVDSDNVPVLSIMPVVSTAWMR